MKPNRPTFDRLWPWRFSPESSVALWIFPSALALWGCATSGQSASGLPGELHLFAVPAALQLDDRPGPDGIGVRVYASAAGKSRGLEIRAGVLEVLLFDGSPTVAQMKNAKPLKIWSFPASELSPFVAVTSLGTGYQMALNWEANRPSGSVVTVIARYHPLQGAELVSSANTIAVNSR